MIDENDLKTRVANLESMMATILQDIKVNQRFLLGTICILALGEKFAGLIKYFF